AFAQLGWDAGAAVLDDDFIGFAHAPGANRDAAGSNDGVGRIGHQVHHGLRDQARVTGDVVCGVDLDRHADVLAEAIALDRQHSVDALFYAHDLEVPLVESREGSQLDHEVSDPM